MLLPQHKEGCNGVRSKYTADDFGLCNGKRTAKSTLHHAIVLQTHEASWRSGDAADCKSVYTGSIPVLASTIPNTYVFFELKQKRTYRAIFSFKIKAHLSKSPYLDP